MHQPPRVIVITSALAHEGKLAAYRHRGYWQNMDSLRDQAVLQALWDSGHPPWCVWREEDGSRRNARMLARQCLTTTSDYIVVVYECRECPVGCGR